MMRRDVRARTGEQQSVQIGEQIRGRDRRIENGNEKRHGTDAVANGGNIFLADHMKCVISEHAAVAGDADDR